MPRNNSPSNDDIMCATLCICFLPFLVIAILATKYGILHDDSYVGFVILIVIYVICACFLEVGIKLIIKYDEERKRRLETGDVIEV